MLWLSVVTFAEENALEQQQNSNQKTAESALQLPKKQKEAGAKKAVPKNNHLNSSSRQNKTAQSMRGISQVSEFQCPVGSQRQGEPFPASKEMKCVDPQGKLQGPYFVWYGNGQLMESLWYKDGKQHGLQQSWWPNGQKMAEGTSVNGARYEAWQYWDMLGRPKALSVKKKTITVPADQQVQDALK